MSTPPDGPVSVVIPCHNEAPRIEDSLEEVRAELSSLGREYEIILAEDGSTDETAEICRDLAHRYPYVSCLSAPERLGLGGSLTRAFRAAQYDTLFYTDADLAADITSLGTVLDRLADFDIIVGSRRMPDHVQDRPARRQITSTVFNGLVRILFGSPLYDHNCGFKAFRRDAVLPLLDDLRTYHLFWETELLLYAQRNGLLINEIPISWTPQESSSVNIVTDGFKMLGEMVALRTRFVLEEIRG